METPDSAMGITAAWMNHALSSHLGEASISAVDVSDIGEGTGIFGEIARVGLTYDATNHELPDSVVVKLPCREPENLAVALALGLYEREIRFFNEIGPTTELTIPECFVAELHDDGGFVLVMEDMGTNHVVGDQVEGATSAQVEVAVEALVELHAPWWEQEALDALDWLPAPNAPAYLATVPGIYRTGMPVLEAEWADRLAPGSVDAARALDPKFELLMERISGGPRTFSHADTRLDNIFFPTDGSSQVAFIDFQLSMRQRGVCDLAYLIGTSMKGPEASQDWERILRMWHSLITDRGITYSWDDCLQHYKESALYYLCGAMSLIGSFDTGNERGAAMASAYTTRIFDHVIDIGATDVIAGL